MSLRSILNFFITCEPEQVERQEKIKSMAKRIITIEKVIRYAHTPEDFTTLSNLMEGFSREYKTIPGHSIQVQKLTQIIKDRRFAVKVQMRREDEHKNFS